MSEDVRTHRSASDYPNAAPLNQPDGQEREDADISGTIAGPAPITVDGYANGLMDDLFGDLERALDGSLQLPNAPLSPAEAISLKRLALAELSLPPVVPPAQDWPFAQPASPPPPRSRRGSETALALPAAAQRPPRRRWQRRLLRLVFGLGVTSLLAGVGTWSLQPENRQLLRSGLSAIAPSPVPPTVTPAPPANPDAEFSRYLQRALAMIEQQPTSGSTIAPPAVPNGISFVPPLVPSLGPLPTAPLDTPAGDRVYVPIYPTSPLPATNAPSSVPLPAQIPAIPTVPQSVPLPANPPALPAPGASATASSPSPATSAAKYTLVGVLELGDRSTALFESNGVARRINIGESIGASGWSLVEVNNQEAIIRRNGEVRSIYVGQAF